MLQTRVSLWRLECCHLAKLNVLLLVSLFLFLDVVSSTLQSSRHRISFSGLLRTVWSSYFLLLLLLPLSSLPLSRLLLPFFLLLFLLLRLLLLSLLLHLSLPAQWYSSQLCRGSVQTEPGCLSGVCQLKPFNQASSLLSQSIWGYSNRHSHLTTVVMSQ